MIVNYDYKVVPNKVNKQTMASGLVVMGDVPCLKGRGFESWCYILDGHLDIFSH